MNNQKSKEAFLKANKYIIGGVNSPVRAFKGVGGTPIFIKSAKGSYVTDIDDNKYIDFVGSWGPMILGHSNPDVLKSVSETMQNGLSFGAPTEIETKLAKLIINRIDCVDVIRMCSSGTEATMSAIRLARGFTKRDLIIKFEGCYHGHSDSLLVKAGSGMLTLGEATSLGVPADFAKHTLILSYNDAEGIKKAFAKYKNQIAAVIVEPIAGNMNLILPEEDFLTTIRNQCDEYGSVFISDEVMTGFRVAKAGAAQLFDFTPDLVTFGKVIGGGMPVGAFGGKKEIMESLAPLGGVYQAGTLSGNPVAMAAGIATLEATEKDIFYDELLCKTNYFAEGIREVAEKTKTDVLVVNTCGMFGLFFTNQKTVKTFSDVEKCSVDKFNKFFHLMLEAGVYFAPSAFEAGFMSIAHTQQDLDETILKIEQAFNKL